MGVSFAEVRRVCQQPVAAGNDVAGLLFGDRASLPFTKLFVDLGLSPSIATVGMLVCGVIGAALQFGGATLALVGALLLLLYYVLDCVDGEVARWRRIEHARWGYYEYLFHFIVKPVTFLSIGFAGWMDHGHMLLVVAGVAAAIATLWLKLFFAVPSLVFVGAVLRRNGSEDRPYREYLAEAERQAAREESAPVAGGKEVDEVFRLRPDLVTVRALGTNFDVGLLLLVLATLVDLFVPAFEIRWLGALGAREIWLLYYGVVLPFDFLDYVQTYVRKGHFDRTMVKLIARAHGFAVAGEPEARSTAARVEAPAEPAAADPNENERSDRAAAR